MICYVCGDFIDGGHVTCRIEEGKHEGKFAYLHIKCAEENLVKVNVEEK